MHISGVVSSKASTMSRNDYFELFRNGVVIRVVRVFLGFGAKSTDDAGDAEGSIVSLARVHICAANVVGCLDEV